MVTKIKVCDNCRRTQNEVDCNIYSFKIKKQNLLHTKIWNNVDICYDCLREIRRIAKDKNNNTRNLLRPL